MVTYWWNSPTIGQEGLLWGWISHGSRDVNSSVVVAPWCKDFLRAWVFQQIQSYLQTSRWVSLRIEGTPMEFPVPLLHHQYSHENCWGRILQGCRCWETSRAWKAWSLGVCCGECLFQHLDKSDQLSAGPFTVLEMGKLLKPTNLGHFFRIWVASKSTCRRVLAELGRFDVQLQWKSWNLSRNWKVRQNRTIIHSGMLLQAAIVIYIYIQIIIDRWVVYWDEAWTGYVCTAYHWLVEGGGFTIMVSSQKSRTMQVESYGCMMPFAAGDSLQTCTYILKPPMSRLFGRGSALTCCISEYPLSFVALVTEPVEQWLHHPCRLIIIGGYTS